MNARARTRLPPSLLEPWAPRDRRLRPDAVYSRINSMTRHEKILEKKKLGRPAIGKGLQFNSMLRPEMAEALDGWILRQPEPRPSRTEAIRRLLAIALKL